MRRLVDSYGAVRIVGKPIFTTLVRAVVSQQLSEAAASTILRRLQEMTPLTPDALLRLEPATFRKCGISSPKAECLRAISLAAQDGELDRIGKLPYDDVMQHLLRIRGVGRWTAQIVLIFGLGRKDVWPHDDVRLQRAAKSLYGTAGPDELMGLGEKFRPFRSYAAWYLWRSLSS